MPDFVCVCVCVCFTRSSECHVTPALHPPHAVSRVRSLLLTHAEISALGCSRVKSSPSLEVKAFAWTQHRKPPNRWSPYHNAESMDTFKKGLKTHLLRKAFLTSPGCFYRLPIPVPPFLPLLLVVLTFLPFSCRFFYCFFLAPAAL